MKLKEKDYEWYLKQSRPVIKFYDKIDANALHLIHTIVLKSGITHRNINEKLIAITTSIKPISSKIVIDTKNLSVLSEIEIIDAIETVGFKYINQGNSKELIEISKELTKSIESSPLVCLILGFASYNIGQFYEALAYIRKAKTNEGLLGDFDQAYLKFLDANIKNTKGIISKKDYEIAISSIQTVESVKLYYELMKIRNEFPLNPETGVKLIQNFVSKIESRNTKYIGINLQAKIELLYAEGWFNDFIGIANIGRINAVENESGMLDPILRQENVIELLNRNAKWENLRVVLYNDILEYGNYLILAKYYQVYVHVCLRRFITNELVVIENKIQEPEEELKEINYFIPLNHFITESITIYREYESNYNLCVALITQFELFEFHGDVEESQRVNNEIYRIATLYDFEDIIIETKNLQNSGSFYKRFIEHQANSKSERQQLKDREYNAFNILKDIDRQEFNLKIDQLNETEEEAMIIDIFNVGFFKVPRTRTEEFFNILGINTSSEVANQLKYLSFELKVIPKLNIVSELISSEGYGEGYNSIKSIEDLERLASRRLKLFEAHFYKQEPYY
ncbi:MAG: hypothetical protein IPH96_17435 [Saprospiraceae bacterium]|nr:hypothetical protein [Saprospiraceae bacterium]